MHAKGIQITQVSSLLSRLLQGVSYTSKVPTTESAILHYAVRYLAVLYSAVLYSAL